MYMIDFHRHITLPFDSSNIDTYWYATTRVSEYPLYKQDKRHYHGYGYLYEENSDDIIQIIERHLKIDSLGYIGEVGIDKNLISLVSLEKQLEVVHSLTSLAIFYKRPIVFHVNASFELMEEIFTLGKGKITMIIHHYTGSVETAHELFNKGVYVCIGPRVWQKEMKLNRRIDELNIPILLETDYTRDNEHQYEKLLQDHYRWYEDKKNIAHTILVEQMHELSSIFQNSSINR
ncbi:MAG: hypothetical protein EOM67_06385 [Spirochaetia bacterium]|nr:hypothetical protein [Spirochaetia bacterium]